MSPWSETPPTSCHPSPAKVRLGQVLAEASGDVEAGIAAYEADLFPRSAEVADEAAQNLVRFFGDAAPQSVVALFSR